MGQSAFDDPTKQVNSEAGAPANAGWRSVVKGGLTLSIMALWQIELLEDQEKNMAENNKKRGSLPAVLTCDDVRPVSPALEQYTRGPTHEHGSTTTPLSPSPRPPRSNSCRGAL